MNYLYTKLKNTRYSNWVSYLFKITNAAITPGTQPMQVKIKVINTEPHPLSITAKGGNIIAKITLNNDIIILFFLQQM